MKSESENNSGRKSGSSPSACCAPCGDPNCRDGKTWTQDLDGKCRQIDCEICNENKETARGVCLELNGLYFAGIKDHGELRLTKIKGYAKVFDGDFPAAMAQRKYDGLEHFRRVWAGI